VEAETRLPSSPIAAAVARRFITTTLSDWQLGAMVDDAVLGGSELVTNAVLHAGGPVALRLCVSGGDLLVEVADPLAPERSAVEAHSTLDHDGEPDARMTGRGLALLAALADAWGVATRPRPGGGDGKVVWFRLEVAPHGNGSCTAEEPETTTAAGSDEERHTALIDVPLGLFVESESHLDDLTRELRLVSWAHPDASRVVRLAEELRRFREDRSLARALSGELARRLLARGRTRMALPVPLDGGAVAEGERFLLVLDEIELLTRTGQLLTPPPTPELSAFRAWFVAELVRQSTGAAPSACPYA